MNMKSLTHAVTPIGTHDMKCFFTRPLTHRGAFTLVELLVVIAIIGVLIGMLSPALQSMREMARRSNCEQNLVQISLALSSYNLTNGHYPIGTQAKVGPIASEPKGFHHNWAAAILPMLDSKIIYSAIDQNASVYASQNKKVRDLRIPTFICPSATMIRHNATCYSGVTGSTETPIDTDNNGTFILNRRITDDDITDGLGYTLFVGEMLSPASEDLGWMSGTRASLRDAGHPINSGLERIRHLGPDTAPLAPGYVGGFESDHPNGAHLLLGSGEYTFRSNSMDLTVLQQMANRSDGELPAAWQSSNSQILHQPKPPRQDADGNEPKDDNSDTGKGEQDKSKVPPTKVDQSTSTSGTTK
jgi:prepilin-type N-terminal cleavage/methylation domain-containing protein